MINKINVNLYADKDTISKNTNKLNTNNNVEEKIKEYNKDTIELSIKNDYNYAKDRNNWVSNGHGGLTPILKGVVQLSSGDFNKIQAASIVPPLSDGLMEIGKDERCKWVVINGVRYETPLSESEKPIKFKSLMDFLNESKKRLEDKKIKEKQYKKSEIINLGHNKAIVYGTLPKEDLEMLNEILGYELK